MDYDDEGEEPPNGPWRDGALWVLTRKCPTCIFRPGNLMMLHEGRVEQMARECIDENTIISCHETLDGPRAICRGLYDVHRDDIAVLQIAERLCLLQFADPPEGFLGRRP